MADTFEEHLCVLFNPDRGVHTGERSPNRGWKLMNHTHATSQTLSGHKEMPNSLLILAPSELFVCVSKSETWVQIKPWHTPVLVNPSALSITSFYLHGSKRLFFVVNFLIAVFNYFGTANYSVIYVKLSLLWWCSKRFYDLVNNTRYYYRLQRKSTLLWPTVLFQCQTEQNGMTLWPTNNHPYQDYTLCVNTAFSLRQLRLCGDNKRKGQFNVLHTKEKWNPFTGSDQVSKVAEPRASCVDQAQRCLSVSPSTSW